jgi:NAD(P)H-hydrate repair Nnr-like enzyme with NAD(P)H-hydrate dehydratase domain
MGVHTRQVMGRLPAGIGGGRQAVSKIELPSILLPCLAACQATWLHRNSGKLTAKRGN